MYTVSEAISGKKICQGTGQQLAQNGFRVKMSAFYSGQLFEVKQLR
jgi:hypothetical protein